LKEGPLGTALSAAAEHKNLLRQMGKLTDQLSDAIRDARMDSINTLLQAREALCKRIAASSSALRRSLAELDVANSPLPGKAVRDDLRRALDDTQRLQDAVLKKQAASESALDVRLHECKMDLVALGQRNGLRSAYQTDQEPTNQARFLDNRL